MNTILPRTISNVEGMNPKLIKVWNVLFALWKHGKHDDRVMPTVKELEKLVGLTDKPINDAIKALQKIRVKDSYQQSFPLLRIYNKKFKDGRVESVYKLAAPEMGELTDPSSFSQEGGGSATMARFHGYITITDEIQKLGLTPNQEMVLAVFNSILEWDEYDWPVYNSATPYHTGWLKCMDIRAVYRAICELRDKGYIEHSKETTKPARNGKTTRGWETMTVNINNEQAIEEETDMDTDKQQMLIEKAMEAGNMELAMKLAEAMAGASKGGTKPDPKKAEKKARSGDVEEMDFQNDFIRVCLSMPKDRAKRSDVRSMIGEIERYLAIKWFTADDVEASGFIDGMADYGVSMSYEVIRETPEEEYGRESTEDAIAASKAENDALFGNEPELVGQTLRAFGYEDERKQSQSNPRQPKPSTREEAERKLKELMKGSQTYFQTEYNGEFTPSGIKWIDGEYERQAWWRKSGGQIPKKQEKAEEKREESRKRAVEEKLDKLECELDEIMKLI